MTNKLLLVIAVLLGLIVFRMYLPFLIWAWQKVLNDPTAYFGILAALILAVIHIKRKLEQLK